MKSEPGSLLRTLPPERRVQARAAITGSVDDVIARLCAVRARPDGGWQATLAATYIEDCAARWRPPDQAAQLAGRLCRCPVREPGPERAETAWGDQPHGRCGGAFVIDAAAAHRSPDDLAVIAARLYRAEVEVPARSGLAERFLHSVAARRLPDEIAAMLVDLPGDGTLRVALRLLARGDSPRVSAAVIVSLRGRDAHELIQEMLSVLIEIWPGRLLAELVAELGRWGDRETVDNTIGTATTWTVPHAPEQTADAVAGRIGQITELVAALCDSGHIELAKQAARSAITHFTVSEERYRLYALIFVFRQHELHDEVDEVIREISADQPEGSVVEMVVRWINENRDRPADTANLLDAILRKPSGDSGDPAITLVRKLSSDRAEIFKRVASWTHKDIGGFLRALRNAVPTWVEGFLDSVADHAGANNDGNDLGNIVLLLLHEMVHRDRDARHKAVRRAERLVRSAVRSRDPDLLVTFIGVLREYRSSEYQITDRKRHEGWWTLRRVAEKEVAENYTAADMVRLIELGADRCPATLLGLAQEWLINPHNSMPDIATVVATLKQVEGDPHDLAVTLEWSASQLQPLDSTTPVAALERAGLQDEANAWVKGRHRNLPWLSRPDPDPPQ